MSECQVPTNPTKPEWSYNPLSMSQDGEHDHVYKPYQNVEGPHYDAFLQTPQSLNGFRKLYLGVYHNDVHCSKVTSDACYIMPANARPYPCIFPDV